MIAPARHQILVLALAGLLAVLFTLDAVARGGGRGGGGGFSRGGVAAGGGFAARPAARPTGGFDRGGAGFDGSRGFDRGARDFGSQGAMRDDRFDARTDRQQVRQDARGDWQQNRQDARREWQDNRGDYQDHRQDYRREAREDWQDYGDDWDHWRPVGYAAAGAAVVAGAYAIGSMLSADDYYALPCEPVRIVVDGFTYYRCGADWYQPSYVGGDTTYLVVNAPPGY